MRLAADLHAGTVMLTAPASGRVTFCPPKTLCGELEVFDQSETLATVEGTPVEAPANGFVLRTFARDGDLVSDGVPILTFRIA